MPGFLVSTTTTYNLIALFRHLGVREAVNDMSFSVHIDSEGIEWAGSSMATLFAQSATCCGAILVDAR
ncbi:MAG: hypothetical protein U1E63_02070 [Burkholderiales bacterium]